MSRLMKAFQSAAKECGMSKTLPSHQTGFAGIDYRNGYVDSESGELRLGLEGGKFIMFVGNSGVGKSTLAMQIAASIVWPYEDGLIVHLDYENATNPARFARISGWPKEAVKTRYDHRNVGIYAESISDAVRTLAKQKLELADEISVDDGAGGKMLPPSVVLVDSIPLIMPKKWAEDTQMDNNMRAAHVAKVLGSMLKECVGPMAEANIYVISVNHLLETISTSMFDRKPAQVNFLRQGEMLPGGRVATYVQNYIFRLDAGRKLDPEKDYGVKGFVVSLQAVKSRTGAAGNTAFLVFDQANGFVPDLGSLEHLKEMKVLAGAAHMRLPNLPDVPFTQKNFLEKLQSEPRLREAFDELVHEQFFSFVPPDPNAWDQVEDSGVSGDVDPEDKEDETSTAPRPIVFSKKKPSGK